MKRIPVRHRVVVFTASVVAFLGAASGATPSPQATNGVPGCAPQCLPPHLSVPGNLPTSKYTTEYFFGGQMTLLFAKGWESGEDSTGEFNAWAKRNPDSRVVFWEDAYATKPGSLQRVGSARRTAASLLAWLRSNPNLTVSKPTTGKIGTLRASVVDIGVADGAVNDDPTCPAKSCANFLGYPQWGEPYGIAGKSVSRFYLADVRYGGKRHLFVAVIEATGASQLKAFLPEARKLIASVPVPASSA